MSQAIYSTQSIRDAELRWAENRDGSTYPLMERAGRAAWQMLHRYWPETECILICCGRGNNGGDGYELGRLAMENGVKVYLVANGGEPRKESDAVKARERFLKSSGKEYSLQEVDISKVDLIVDAVLGTGVVGAVRETALKAIDYINQAEVPVFSLDVPSGLNSDSGIAEGACVKADLTLSFIGLKTGLTTGDASRYIGELRNADLAMDWIGNPTAYLIDPKNLSTPQRSASDHKGSQGQTFILAGNREMGGAALMAADAATRMGLGLIRLATHQSHTTAALIRTPEVMVSELNPEELFLEVLDGKEKSSLVFGPGIGADPWARKLFHVVLEYLQRRKVNAVLDADALNMLAETPNHYSHWVLTPHPGEAARLLGCSIADINSDRLESARAIQKKYGGICVLKGAGTIVCDGQCSYINSSGNGGMAKPGMGDLLAGMAGALLARLEDPLAAVKLAVWMHGKAGDEAAAQQGQEALRATDLISCLPNVWSELSSN